MFSKIGLYIISILTWIAILYNVRTSEVVAHHSLLTDMQVCVTMSIIWSPICLRCQRGNCKLILVCGTESKKSSPREGDPLIVFSEGILYSFLCFVNHVNAANRQKYEFLYKQYATFSHFWLH